MTQSLAPVAPPPTEAVIVTRPSDESLAQRHEWSVEDLIGRINKVHDVMKRAMQDGHHYGVIPGTPKPTLLKPGAELLCLMFRLDPQYEVTRTRDADGSLDVLSRCVLWHIPTGQRYGSGMGSCSSRESKYAYRDSKRACPTCGQTTIIKGKEEYGGGWLCFKKKGGCGAKFKDGDATIEGQTIGRVENEDVADQENTVLKMANKRSLIAAVLNVTAASDIFTQDLEDTTQTPLRPLDNSVEGRLPTGGPASGGTGPSTSAASSIGRTVDFPSAEAGSTPAAATTLPDHVWRILSIETDKDKLPDGCYGLVRFDRETLPAFSADVLAKVQQCEADAVPVIVTVRLTGRSKTRHVHKVQQYRPPQRDEHEGPVMADEIQF